uniref:Uncharacterized protein n=1 Tax=Arundo donax TaxID=35708 RepID=A0A0A9BT73_ARUDO
MYFSECEFLGSKLP